MKTRKNSPLFFVPQKSPKFFREAQMEILGLAIVVVIILVAMIFVVRFLIIQPQTEYRKPFVSSETASNMLNSFLKTAAAQCSKLTMTELLEDCAQSKAITCSNGMDSCAYVQSTAETIFGKTLADWNVKYGFSAYTDKDSPLIQLGDGCSGERRSKLFAIPTSTATVYVYLELC